MKERLCRNCKHVKILDEKIGRCMREKYPPLFCKLDDQKHPCEHYKERKEQVAS